MKALLIEKFVKDYDELQPQDVAEPETSGKVLVRITQAGLNYVDLLYSRGKHQNNRSLVRPPFILGLEFAGIVVSTPPDSSFKRGDSVFGGGGVGGFAEYISVKEDALQKVPRGWTAQDAAGIAATAPVSYGALVQIGQLASGEFVLVHAAAGGLGVMAVQIALALGAKVIATVGSEHKEAVVRRLGVKHVVDYSIPKWEQQVLQITNGRGVDLTFDSVGLVEESIRCSRHAARIVIVGFAGREGNLEKISANRILLKSIKLMGYRYGELGRQYPETRAAAWKGVATLLSKGSIRPVIYDDEKFQGLQSVPRAMKAMAARKTWGKVIIDVSSPSIPSNL